jgi:hypothetical protein
MATKPMRRQGIMGGRGQRRYWLANRADGIRGLVRATLLPQSLCGSVGRITGQTCDRKRGHRGIHQDRRWVAKFKGRNP